MSNEEPRPYVARFDQKLWARMERQKTVNAIDYATIVRRGVERELRALENPEATPLTLKLKHGAPCGDWQDVREDDEQDYELSPDQVSAWHAIPGDFLLHTEGASMLGAGIPENAILHMRRFGMGSPKSGQVCAILAIMDDGTVQGTVKHWQWSGKRNIELTDGEGKKLEVPENAREIEANAYWVKGNVIGLPAL